MTQAPFFEDFNVGDDFSDVPAITLTNGHAAIHQAMFADRSKLTLDHELSRMVTGRDRALVNASLVANIAIGQSTLPSQRVMGNLFYRGLHFKQPVFIGETLNTCTRVVALRQNTIKENRAASGMVALEIIVNNQLGENVLHFWRCPMIPCRDPHADTGLADDFSIMPAIIDDQQIHDALPHWDFACFRASNRGQHFVDYQPGDELIIEARDTVTMAPELVRMTQNLAMTHTDSGRSVYNKRLVYGGHTISMAAAHVSRAFPNLVTILAWYHCNHVAPVFEEDILGTTVRIERSLPLTDAGMLVINVDVHAERGPNAPEAGEQIKVLDWKIAVLLA